MITIQSQSLKCENLRSKLHDRRFFIYSLYKSTLSVATMIACQNDINVPKKKKSNNSEGGICFFLGALTNEPPASAG